MNNEENKKSTKKEVNMEDISKWVTSQFENELWEDNCMPVYITTVRNTSINYHFIAIKNVQIQLYLQS